MLQVTSLYKEHKDRKRTVKAVDGISFEVQKGQLFTLLGPSGCGKTTTLRSIAGLERPNAGHIVIGDRVVYSSADNIFVPPNEREIGMVFQSYAIWPHMTVFQNAAFPLEVGKRKYSKQEIHEKVLRALHTVALDGLESREATRLSGGQQQRLALARALVMEPALLLLDEPLSNLDAKLRERMRFELKRLQRDLGITTVYVTHDQTEALALSNRIAVIQEGKIIQVGRPREIYEQPNSEFVADFIGTTNLVTARLLGPAGDPDHYQVQTPFGPVLACSPIALTGDSDLMLSIRPENVELTMSQPARQNVFEVRIRTRVFLGDYTDLQLEVGEHTLLARVHDRLEARTGSTVYAYVDPAKCIVLPRS